MLTTPENILMLLGYSVPTVEQLTLISLLPDHVGNRLDGLVTSLTAIDNALATAPLDSMAVKVDKLEVSYSQHLVLLKKEASRMLQEISILTLVPLYYDRYTQKMPTVTRASFLNVVSYW